MHLRMFWGLAEPCPGLSGSAGLRAALGLARRFELALALLVTLLGAPLQAQQAQPVYDPTQFERRFSGEQTPAARRSVPIPHLAQPAAAQADRTPLFVLRHVAIIGATAIPPAHLASAYQPYLGRKVSQADLAGIAVAISELYREAGFHLSRAIVPPQDINGGSIRVQVIEGSITAVELKGAGAEEFGVRPMLQALLAEQPSRLSTLERQLLLVNGRPGVRIEDTTLEEIGKTSGHFRLTLFLKTSHITTSFGLDNLGSSAVGPWESYASAAFNSLLTPGDTLAVNLSTTPADPRQLAFARLSYDTPVGTDGWKVGASAYYSDVWPGDYRHAFSDNTKTESFELRSSFAALQSQRYALTLTAAFDFINSAEGDLFGLVYSDHIRLLTFTADSRWQDNVGGNNYLTATMRQGLNIFDATPSDDIFSSHFGASPTFTAFNAYFTRYQSLGDVWSLKIAGAGQWASGPLFLSQQFYLGGAAFGRGYGAAETSGDNGLGGTLELRFDQRLGFPSLRGYQLYAFLDSGVAWNAGFRPADGVSLTSAGGGVRFFLANNTQADLAVAVPLTYRAPENPGRDVRVLFSLTSALEFCPSKAATRCL